MNSNEIFEAIEEIASTASKNEKIEILKKYKDDEAFKKVLNLALNPFITFGMQQMPEQHAHLEAREFTERTWLILEQLASRELSGGDAKLEIADELGQLEDNSAELLTRILRKDLKAGFGESTVNKVIKGFIPEFPYMRCSLPKEAKLDKWEWQRGIFSQEKADGMFANVDHDIAGNVSIRSRQGSEFPMIKFSRIVDEISENIKTGTQSHGEFLVMVDDVVAKREIGNGIMNRIISGGDFLANETPILKLWDSIPMRFVVAKGKYDVAYESRLAGLYAQLPKASEDVRHVNVIDTRLVRSLKEAYTHYKEMLTLGKEGVVIKTRTGWWADNTSKDQVKLKLDFIVDLLVIEIMPGKVGSKNEGRAGALRCSSADGLLLVDVAVKNEDMRNRVEASPEDWLGSIVAVVANDLIQPSKSNNSHSLFLPRMTEAYFRTDKFSPDSLAHCIAQYEAAIQAV